MSGPEPMTRANLDLLGGREDVITITPVCHRAPVFVGYSKPEGCLVLMCAVCKRFVAKLLIAATDTGDSPSREVH